MRNPTMVALPPREAIPVRAGRAAEAKEPLQAVKAPSFATVVRLWQLYIDSKAAPAAAGG